MEVVVVAGWYVTMTLMHLTVSYFMTAVSPVVKPVSQMQLAPGSAVAISDVSGEEFESILQEMGKKRSAPLYMFPKFFEGKATAYSKQKL